MLKKRIALFLFLITALVFIGLVTWLTLSLRSQLRTVFIDQHGEILQPLAATQLAETREILLLTGDLIEASELLGLALADVNVDELVDVRLFDTDGFLIAEDFATALSVALHPQDRLRALKGLPSTRYHPKATLQALFPGENLTDRSLGVPLIEVVVPLRDDEDANTVAMARYLLNGEKTQRDLAAMDRQLWSMSGSLLLAALLVLGGVFYGAFGQLARSRRMLEESNRRLVELNHQLAFADKSSAIGALSAHLVHGLKNPLEALRMLLEGTASQEAENRRHGVERVREMQNMIDELVSVMRDEETGLVYEYLLEEVRQLLIEKTRLQTARSGVHLEMGPAPEHTLTGREGNVVLLILVNLIDNAMEASPRGTTVKVGFERSGDYGITIRVEDEGEGIPEELQARLFVPKKSGKERGGGIGLVIAAQLTRQIGGHLRLVKTGPEGTSFELTL